MNDTEKLKAIEDMMGILAKMAMQRDFLEKALSFYADEDIWEDYGVDALGDAGDKARAALLKLNKMKGKKNECKG